MSIRFYSSPSNTEPIFEITLSSLNQLSAEKNLRRHETTNSINFEITWGELKDAINTYLMSSGVSQGEQTIRYIQIFDSMMYSVVMYILYGGTQTAYDAFNQRVQIGANIDQLPDSTVITITFDRKVLPESLRADYEDQINTVIQTINENGGIPPDADYQIPDQMQTSITYSNNTLLPASASGIPKTSNSSVTEGFKTGCNRSNLLYYLVVFLVLLLILFVLFWGGCSIVKMF